MAVNSPNLNLWGCAVCGAHQKIDDVDFCDMVNFEIEYLKACPRSILHF